MKYLTIFLMFFIGRGVIAQNSSDDSLKIILELKEKNGEYSRLILLADDAFLIRNYLLAKETYQKALTIKPMADYPLSQIELIVSIQKAEAKIQINEQYRKLVAAADKNFSEGNYEKAYEYYLRASHIKPNDEYVSVKLKKSIELKD